MGIMAFFLRLGTFFSVASGLIFAGAAGNCRIEPEFVIDIQRTGDTPREQALIAAAEAHCPPYEEVAAVFEGEVPPESMECLWYYTSYGDLLIPYAITSEAIIHYEAQVRAAEAAGGRVVSRFLYEAEVRTVSGDPQAPQGAVESVHMSLDYTYVCGGLCGVFVSQERIVYFDAEGNVLLVVGDSPSLVGVA